MRVGCNGVIPHFDGEGRAICKMIMFTPINVDVCLPEISSLLLLRTKFSSHALYLVQFIRCFFPAPPMPYSYVTWPYCVEHDHSVNSMQLSLIF